MERPDNLKSYPERDLKLGIKSSLPKPKATIGLFILIWGVMNKPASIIYADEDSGKLNLKKEIFEKIKLLRNSTDIDENNLKNCISENNLLTSQLEALIVAFELVWPLGKIEFENGMTATAERTGRLRYSKKIHFTINMDFIDLAFQNEKNLFYDVLLNWIGVSEIRIENRIESRLIRLLTLMSEKAIYKLQDDNTGVIFNNLSIYSKVSKNLSLDIKGDVEAKGSLRILLSELRENLNSYLLYDGNQVTKKTETENDLDSYSKRVDTYLLLMNEKSSTVSNNNNHVQENSLHLPRNRIIFGAPGTGKSHLLENQREEYFGDNDHYERVTFHPNYTYSQFVGAYKPVALKNKSVESLDSKTKDILLILNDKTKTAQEKYDLLFNKFKENENLTRLPILLGICEDEKFQTKNVDYSPGSNNVERAHGKAIKPYVKLRSDDATSNDITYSFVPGPFVRTLMKAKQTPSENFLLVIEEINRANAAAVFGDVFQLLDRDEDGKSEYPIDASEDLKKYLEESGVALEDGKIEIPANMYIWATMNSADQGVAPLDAAFKRRWEFEYIGIDDNENEVVDCEIPIPKKENSNGDFDFVSWNGFRKALNEKLKGLSGVNEDKLLGPFFISKHRLETAKENAEDFIKFFKSKVLMYLYEDVCKMNPCALFNGISEGVRLHYSDICAEFDKKGLGIFGTDFSAHS